MIDDTLGKVGRQALNFSQLSKKSARLPLFLQFAVVAERNNIWLCAAYLIASMFALFETCQCFS